MENRECLECDTIKPEGEFPLIQFNGLQKSIICSDCLRNWNDKSRPCRICKRFTVKGPECNKCLIPSGYRVCKSCKHKKSLASYYKKRADCIQCISSMPRVTKLINTKNTKKTLKCIKCKLVTDSGDMWSKRVCRACYSKTPNLLDNKNRAFKTLSMSCIHCHLALKTIDLEILMKVLELSNET